ncbi:hypothetical protein V490_00903 [Pseudogymnoascus sp. VKM F-3557]|nr:hypothetical protein V490_00903 [Pseudogymnoascus sp. VKM F-3557]
MQCLHQAWRNVCEAAARLRSIENNGDADISPTCKLAYAAWEPIGTEDEEGYVGGLDRGELSENSAPTLP